MYIRPTFISMDNRLGLSYVKNAKIFVCMSPVGPYFSQGFKGVDIICNDETVSRTWKGGFGAAKLGA
jgi:branched-chain amino acid aminotransferase